MSFIDTIVLMVLCITALSPLFAGQGVARGQDLKPLIVWLFAIVGLIGLVQGLIRLVQAVPVFGVMATSFFGAVDLVAWVTGFLIGAVLLLPVLARLRGNPGRVSRWQVPLGIAGLVVFAIRSLPFGGGSVSPLP